MRANNIEQILEMQQENYKNRIGTTFGIFRIDDINYNWQAHTQEWAISCMKCGHVETVTHSVGLDWLRGKGRSRDKCKYCKEREIESKKIEKIKKEKDEIKKLDDAIGQTINGWVIESRKGKQYSAVCNECGNKRKLQFKDIQDNNVECCRHPNGFSDPEYIGRRYGNLTIIGYSHGQFITRCDCGFEKPIKCSAVVNGKTATCGRVECEYHVERMNLFGKRGSLIAALGEKAEIEVSEYLKSLGYTVQKTKRTGDYGVDIICIGRKGERVAIQVKNNASTKSKVDVHAVQEVYAGGTFYDCNKYAVVSYTGFTDNAKVIADKLGVMLCNERCELFDFDKHYPINTKHIWFVDGKEEPMLTTFKRNGWDCKNVSRYVGMTYEQVKEIIEKTNKKKEMVKIRKEFGLSQSMVAYRMKKIGMTFEEAISTPKLTTGRHKKQEKTA